MNTNRKSPIWGKKLLAGVQIVAIMTTLTPVGGMLGGSVNPLNSVISVSAEVNYNQYTQDDFTYADGAKTIVTGFSQSGTNKANDPSGKDIRFPDNVRIIAERAFENARLTNVDLNQITEVRERGFANNSIIELKNTDNLVTV